MNSKLAGACTLIFAFLFCVSLDVPTATAVTNIDGIWSALDSGAPAPSARREYAAVHDRKNQRYLIFAGFTNNLGDEYFLFNDVWVLTLDSAPTWSLLTIPGDVPGERHSPQWGFDPARNRVLVFGGYGSHYPGQPYEYLNDVWELMLDGDPQWRELIPTGTPPAGRLVGAAVYDVLHQRFVGFGGTAGLPVDTWQLDLRDQPAWSTVETDGVSPPGGYGMTSIFDATLNRMLIFGGSISADYFGTHNDTWELDLQPETPQWRKLNPVGPLPLARRSLTSVFDPRRDRMVIFGGWDGMSDDPSSFLNDTWALSLTSSGDGEWTQLSPDGLVPVGDVMAAAYDPLGDRMVLFGGWSGTGVLGDTQFLTWDDAGQAAIVTSSGELDNGVARLEWSTQNITSAIVAVYRREPGTEWTSIGVVEADGLGQTLKPQRIPTMTTLHVSFEDNTITPGQDYGYQIIVSSEVGDEVIGEIWLDGNATDVDGGAPNAALALQVWPNPTAGPFAISVASPSTESARVEMFDVRGRHVLSRELGSIGAGARVEIGNAKNYPSGVYYLRLTQSGRSTSSHLVLVR